MLASFSMLGCCCVWLNPLWEHPLLFCFPEPLWPAHLTHAQGCLALWASEFAVPGEEGTLTRGQLWLGIVGLLAHDQVFLRLINGRLSAPRTSLRVLVEPTS